MATSIRERAAMLDTIGKTPIVRLTRLPDAASAEVWVKLEAANPTGSYKDRMALAMIEGGERSGRLRPGQTVVEYTGGSTGSSLALVCALKGYPLRIVTSDAFAAEKIRTMEAFGAELEVLPSPQGITPDLVPRMMERAAEIVAEIDGFATDQFNNKDMLEGYRSLGREILEQLDEPPDAFCGYIGTAGCFVGEFAAGRGRAGGVARPLARNERDASHRGRRRRLLAAPARAGRHGRDHRGLRRGGIRHGEASCSGGRRLLRPLQRREHHGYPGRCEASRPRPPRRDDAGRLGPQVPRRPAVLVLRS
jgi:hypothetical protein